MINEWFHIEWHEILVPSLPVGEMLLRGTLVYLALFALLRFILTRAAGAVGTADLLLVVLLAHGADRALTKEYESVADGAILVATIVFWHYTLNWLAFRFPLVERFVRPPALPLVKNGRMIRANMRRELITSDELMGMLREQGVGELSAVREAHMEGDGRVSVVTHDSPARPTPERSLP